MNATNAGNAGNAATVGTTGNTGNAVSAVGGLCARSAKKAATALGAVTALSAVRFTYGTAEATVPDFVSRHLAGRPLDRHERFAARVLGVRHTVQAGAATALASPSAYRLGAGVDALHALSMVGLAAVDRRRRRLALTETAIASAMAFAGLHAARRAGQAQQANDASAGGPGEPGQGISSPATPASRSPRP
ncbi:hypothetical protein [Actinopolymorpha singaporensis]|uniref:Uncharacterized protein n=1 Tax=Actinopolymorpha singaporensis TaxID=117157 RepID=A0A1H1WJ65_9ACTN|nr:hypothetical protein [Actinopolymorpha singaporensis]SDS97358.1 hypothetical protein SAMN04489717_4550 [Actinopolymorpha singaporensis]